MTIFKELRKLSNKKIASSSLRFFKTGPGEYGHGDIFLGIRVPILRKLSVKYIDLSISDTKKLIHSKYHEERLIGLFIIVNKFKKADNERDKDRYYNIYINSFKYINNWDLVDTTCPHIVGEYLINKDRKILYTWARSNDLWTKRIAIVTNWWFIRNNDLKDIFKIAKILLKDEHDLIHKAVGWMLREAAKKDQVKAEFFLNKHYRTMPRTMLRYSIERFPENLRQKYLKGKI